MNIVFTILKLKLMRKSYLKKSSYLFILVSFFSCSNELIEVEVREEPIIATFHTPPETEFLWGWVHIDIDTIKEIFQVDESFTDPLLEQFCNRLQGAPGINVILNHFRIIGRKIKLVYNPKLSSSYGNNTISLSELDMGHVLEELIHAYHGHFLRSDGTIPAFRKLNAELDAKFYVTFVMTTMKLPWPPFNWYTRTSALFEKHNFAKDAINYTPPYKEYSRSVEVIGKMYKEFYEAFVKDTEGILPYSAYKGTPDFTNGFNEILYLLSFPDAHQ